MAIMGVEGLLPLLALCVCGDVECERAATFAIGSLAECSDVKGKIVELGGTVTMINQGRSDDLEVRRSCGYFLGLLAEQVCVCVCLSLCMSVAACVWILFVVDPLLLRLPSSLAQSFLLCCSSVSPSPLSLTCRSLVRADGVPRRPRS
jgi:hypothetical protein